MPIESESEIAELKTKLIEISGFLNNNTFPHLTSVCELVNSILNEDADAIAQITQNGYLARELMNEWFFIDDIRIKETYQGYMQLLWNDVINPLIQLANSES